MLAQTGRARERGERGSGLDSGTEKTLCRRSLLSLLHAVSMRVLLMVNKAIVSVSSTYERTNTCRFSLKMKEQERERGTADNLLLVSESVTVVCNVFFQQ